MTETVDAIQQALCNGLADLASAADDDCRILRHVVPRETKSSTELFSP